MFEKLDIIPQDPILSLMMEFQGDNNPNKVDLGVGVYKTPTGETPILASVKTAEEYRWRNEATKSYIGGPGNADFNQLMRELALGKDHKVLAQGRVASIQAPGGCGSLRLGAELINRIQPGNKIWMSNPTWANHVPLFGEAGLEIAEYPYYDRESCSVRFDEMYKTLEQEAKAGDVVLLHACCHNPCGADLNTEQWQAMAELCKNKSLVPFLDMAYQGFGTGLVEDTIGVRTMADTVDEMFVAISCSKNFGLYRERIGLLMAISKDSNAAQAVSSQLINIARGIWSMPPAHGAALVATILGSDELTKQWEAEVKEMRDRINGLRSQAVAKLNAACNGVDFSFIEKEFGMFSFLGISPEQVAKLKADYGIYMVSSSRINVAGLNESNLDYFADSVAKVL
ncbi:amino acid aminotransferase [uncultured Pseudoteredinibacter sp.]|uniref:amino acid aminotransferase n=1 Tax=uncultured Pseudoteredinibacter sp. TaxID=1641701 RepID=UPI002620E8FC|nr:amino acid aminotransferase [uncultured Pseudoteredinibacter sp.]